MFSVSSDIRCLSRVLFDKQTMAVVKSMPVDRPEVNFAYERKPETIKKHRKTKFLYNLSLCLSYLSITLTGGLIHDPNKRLPHLTPAIFEILILKPKIIYLPSRFYWFSSLSCFFLSFSIIRARDLVFSVNNNNSNRCRLQRTRTTINVQVVSDNSIFPYHYYYLFITIIIIIIIIIIIPYVQIDIAE